MNKKLFLFVLILLPAICFSQQDSININLSEIYKCWKNSREEYNQNSSSFIYRPCEYKTFPPSRFREQFEFEENGKCSWLQLAPNDGHFMVQGEWIYNKEKHVLLINNKSGKIIYYFKLNSLSKDLMKLEVESGFPIK